ncbi:hypothetical protein N9L68_05255 [bacterium]|nr:hypothetical protein [bacterium]
MTDGRRFVEPPVDISALPRAPADAHWMLMAAVDPAELPGRGYPAVSDGKFVITPRMIDSEVPRYSMWPSLGRASSGSSGDRGSPIQIICSSANVLTLGKRGNDDDMIGLNIPNRSRALQQQFHDAQLHSVGIQEARSSLGFRTHDLFHVVSSGCTPAGTHGCEFLAATAIDLGNGFSHAIQSSDTQVLEANHRVLPVAVVTSNIKLNLLVAHAPCFKCIEGIANYAVLREW